MIRSSKRGDFSIPHRTKEREGKEGERERKREKRKKEERGKKRAINPFYYTPSSSSW
jgi:hypothetical protein